MSPRILAIDPSLAGCAVVRAVGRLEDAYVERIVTKPAKGVRARVHRYRSIVEPIVELARKGADLVLVEGYSFGSHDAGSHDRVELGGILRDRLCDLAPVIEVPPSTLKKWACGKGNAKKAEVVSALSRRFDRHFENDDEADAFALAALGLYLLDPAGKTYAKPQLEVASALLPEVQRLLAAYQEAA